MRMLLGLFVCMLFFGENIVAQNYILYDGDTINRVDDNNQKQGEWVYFGRMKNEPEFKPDQIVEEGNFKNNRKQGVWLKYWPNGKVHTLITYVNNVPRGEYKVYYENGQLEEHGHWKTRRNVGDFKRFYENGEPMQDFIFNQSGKRDGEQKYFYDNGQLMIIGNIQEGKEVGEFKEYYADGSLKSLKYFDEPGKVNHAKTVTKDPIDKALASKDPVMETIDETKEAKVEEGAQQNAAQKKVNPFNGNGEHTLYNKNKQISQKGIFKNYKLIDGQYYRYNDDGILIAIERYKKGKYVGDVPIEE
ncbi:MAG: hypothetical protein MRY83_08210 [Flavobacteriales bacterium]|nr:hypothetical protein [Flavobacteriales bacterium]